MTYYPYTITAIAKNTTGGSNIVPGAMVSILNSSGNPQEMFDDSSGSNGSTGKVADTSGQVTIYIPLGEYSLNVNGTANGKFIVSSSGYSEVDTFTNLQLHKPTQDGQSFVCQERANAKYILQTSGYVALAGDVTFANGRVGQLQVSAGLIAENFGLNTAESDVNNKLSLQDAIDRLAGGSGDIKIIGGDYSLVSGLDSLTVGNSAINFILEDGSKLPSDAVGVSRSAGVYQMPTSSIGSNRTVTVHSRLDAGNASAGDSAWQYVHHIDGFLNENGSVVDTEFRGYSFDIGTDAIGTDREVRGIKGRTYGDGGASNIRGIYSFVEGVNGSGFSGQLTGFLATVYKNDTSASESVGIRSHVDEGCQAAFQAAGAGITAVDTVSVGYSCRTGTGQPLLPTVACFQAHGGGAGDMFLGYASNTDVDVATAPFRVKNSGITKTAAIYSDSATVSDDSVEVIVAPFQSGMFEVFASNTGQAFGKCYFRVAGSQLATEAYSGTLTDFTNSGALTGTTGTDGNLTIGVDNSGNVYVENRLGGSKEFVWVFTGK